MFTHIHTIEHLHNFEDAFNEIKVPEGGINEPGRLVHIFSFITYYILSSL